MPFPTIQNGLYNFMMQALGMTNASNLQLIQPAVPFPHTTSNATLWSWMNDIPPFTLIQSGSGGNQFFSDYETVMSALKPSVTIDFAGDIGPQANAAWLNYLTSLTPIPTPTQQPSLFFNWAFTHGFYSVAEKGSSDLSAMILEPIYRAQLALQPYVSIPNVSTGKAPDWSLGYSQLLSELNTAPSKSLQTADVRTNSNVSGSWAASGSSGGFLLWGGSSSSSSSSISANFSSQAVAVSISFDHALTFVPVPGGWYDSGAFGLAYSNQTGLPWNAADTAVNWQKTFGANGNMQRFAGSLVVVSGMKVTATSSYAFSHADQTTINQNSSAGFWPFYSSGSSSTVTTSHSFNQQGHMTITQTSAPGVPIMIGLVVIPVAQYLGFANTGRSRFLQLAHAVNLEKILA